MMKEIQRKKKVLIDLTNYGSLTAGFGQIAANYATAFSSMLVDDLHFVYLLRQKYMQEFGPNVTSVPVRRINKFFPFTLPKVDVWHAVNQQRIIRGFRVLQHWLPRQRVIQLPRWQPRSRWG